MYMPVISQAINLPCADTYLGYTEIPRNNNDLKKHKSLQNVHLFTTGDLWVRKVYIIKVSEKLYIIIQVIFIHLGPIEVSTLCWLP